MMAAPHKPYRAELTKAITDGELRRLLLLPALRKLDIIRRYYRLGQQRNQIARETGLTVPAVNSIIGRVRKLMGPGSPVTFLQHARHLDPWLFRNDDGWGYGVKIRRGRKSVPDWAYDDAYLERMLLEPSMTRYRAARLYFIEGMSAAMAGTSTRLSRKTVEDLADTIREIHRNPIRRRTAFVVPPNNGKLRVQKRKTI